MKDNIIRIHNGRGRNSNVGGAVKCLSRRPKRSGEQSEKLPEFPFRLSEMFPEKTDFCPGGGWGSAPSLGICTPLPPPLLQSWNSCHNNEKMH